VSFVQSSEKRVDMLRTLRALVVLALGALALHCPSVSVAQQVYERFDAVDFFYSQDPQVFKTLWQAAHSQTVRIAVLGDSQEQSPGSHGFQYIPLLNYEMWKRFGNSPETPIEGCFHYGGGGTAPPANWLVAGRCAIPGPVATRLDSSQILPNARPRAFSTLNASTNITGGNRGQLTMLQQDAIDVDPSTGIPTSVSYFDTSGVVKARIFAATNPSSGEIAYQAHPNVTHVPAYSAAVTASGTITLGLQSPTFAVKSGDTPALDFNGNRYMALEVFGTSDTELTDIIGLRFFNETHPEGVVVDTFSLGGYSASTFLRDHADAGPMFNAFGFHAAILHYGANGLSAEEFRSNISGVISRVRAWVGDPAFPIILVADVYQSGLSPERTIEYDQYVGAQLAIAQADSHVMVINARRLMEDIGWNATSGQSGLYLEDGVHYTGLGAQMLSAAVASALMGEVHISGCSSDPGAVSLQSSMTLVVDLGGRSACTNHGQLRVAQSLTLQDPALQVELTNGFVPAAGDQFKILSFATASGSFGSIALPTLPDGSSWNTSALYTTGTISVDGASSPPPPPPTAPTISVTSGASQSVTLPDAPSPIAFALSGSGALTVTASSSNTALLPQSGISISSGCGAETSSCTAALTVASGQTGSSTVSLTVTDTHGQTAVATATLEVNAASEPGTGTGTGGDAGNSGGGGGGGGSLGFVSLLAVALLLSRRFSSASIRLRMSTGYPHS
jgi:hypothetical protein